MEPTYGLVLSPNPVHRLVLLAGSGHGRDPPRDIPFLFPVSLSGHKKKSTAIPGMQSQPEPGAISTESNVREELAEENRKKGCEKMNEMDTEVIVDVLRLR